jgi:NodT family efflux transporter outer membrane factor (OMF) lipoprotein
MIRLKRRLRKRLLCGILLLLVGGCSPQVKKPVIPVKIPDSFSATGTAPLPEKWWSAFEDDELDSLIESALTNNFDLQTTWDRLAQAEAIARKNSSTLWPEVALETLFRRRRQDNQGLTTYSSLYTLGIAASYEVDLWSKLRSLQNASQLDVEASRDAVDTAAITLAASIANTWYQLGENKDLVRIAQEQIETNKKVLDIVTVQFRKGMASAADVLRQRQLVASTEALLITAEETVELLQYQLSVLIGKQPVLDWQQTSIDFPDLPPMPEIGIPAEVLQRRPDVRQRYRQIQAADQRLAAAIADQYPRISILADIETSSGTSVHDLFDDWLSNLAANALQPLFDADLRKAEVERQKAVVSERVHTWGQTTLYALQDVEAALTWHQQQTQLLENLKHQLSLARQTYQRNRESYIKGQVDYIRVLESLQSLQELERNVVRAQSNLIQSRIDLYRSIAGPFDLSRPALVHTNNSNEMEAASENVTQDE